MQDDDRTVLMCLEDDDKALITAIKGITPNATAQMDTKSIQIRNSIDIPFMYSKQNQPFLRALRALYFEIYLIERGDSNLNSTRLREKIIHLMDNHMKSFAELRYENTHIMIIRYILATFIDELLGAVQWKGADGWLNQYSIL